MHGEPVPGSTGEGADDAIERAPVPAQVLLGTMVVGVVMVGGAAQAAGPGWTLDPPPCGRCVLTDLGCEVDGCLGDRAIRTP